MIAQEPVAETIWQRTLTIYADVPDSWLDGDGQDSDTDRAIGWTELRDEVRKAIDRIYAHRSGAYPKFDVDWEDKAERKEK